MQRQRIVRAGTCRQTLTVAGASAHFAGSGRPAEAYRRVLQGAGLVVVLRRGGGGGLPAGSVLAAEPPGTMAEPGSTVTVARP